MKFWLIMQKNMYCLKAAVDAGKNLKTPRRKISSEATITITNSGTKNNTSEQTVAQKTTQVETPVVT